MKKIKAIIDINYEIDLVKQILLNGYTDKYSFNYGCYVFFVCFFIKVIRKGFECGNIYIDNDLEKETNCLIEDPVFDQYVDSVLLQLSKDNEYLLNSLVFKIKNYIKDTSFFYDRKIGIGMSIDSNNLVISILE